MINRARPAAARGNGEQPNPHAEWVRALANGMLRTGIWPALATVTLGAVASLAWLGVPGLTGALLGGAVAFGSSLLTISLMRMTSTLPPTAVMAAALGGYVGKMLVLVMAMTLVGTIPGVAVPAVAFTMLATILVWTAADVRAFRQVKIPVVVPASGEP